jgi:hypothetical protein
VSGAFIVIAGQADPPLIVLGAFGPHIVFTSISVALLITVQSPLPGTVPLGVHVQCDADEALTPVAVVVQVFPAHAAAGNTIQAIAMSNFFIFILVKRNHKAEGICRPARRSRFRRSEVLRTSRRPDVVCIQIP